MNVEEEAVFLEDELEFANVERRFTRLRFPSTRGRGPTQRCTKTLVISFTPKRISPHDRRNYSYSINKYGETDSKRNASYVIFDSETVWVSSYDITSTN